MGFETEVFLVMSNRRDGSTPDPSEAIPKHVSGLIFDHGDAMEAHRKTVQYYGPDYGVYRATLNVGPRIDLEDLLDPDNLNEWQRKVLEDYPARGSILSNLRSVEDRARIIGAGLAGEDEILVNALAALGTCGSADEAAEVIEAAADFAWRAMDGASEPDHRLYEQAKLHFSSVAEEIKGSPSLQP